MTVARRLVRATLALAALAVAVGALPAAAAEQPWSQAASMLQPHQAATATLLPSGKVLVVGSFPELKTGAELYDPTSDSWSPAAPMIMPRALATATLLPSGKVLIAGGIAADTAHSTTKTELFDPTTNSWSVGAAMAVARSSHTATLLPGGKVLVTGGQNAAGYIATAELYDPVSDSWTMAARMDAGYVSSTATLLPNGKVLVAGGATFGDGRAELYDPATNRWSNAGTTGRIAETATPLANGRVLITGAGQEADLYDAATGRWSDAARMLQDRVNPSATLLADGRVLVAGGTTTIDGQQRWLTSAEIYDPTSNRWSAAGCMAQARWAQIATLLPTKKVLIAGGSAPSVSFASAELFDSTVASSTTAVDTCPTNSANEVTPPSPSGSQAASPPSATPVSVALRRTSTTVLSSWTAFGLVAALLVLVLAGGLWFRARTTEAKRRRLGPR
jgi:N-acetylneuraminic acid mutarotase